MRQADGTALARANLNDAEIRQLFQMEVDGRRGLQPYGLANLPDRGGIALFMDAGGDVICCILESMNVPPDRRCLTGREFSGISIA